MGAPYHFESAAWRRGISRLAGVDEAGRGPLAGPVVAAAVVLAPGARIAGVDDSKRLLPEERQRLFDVIRERAVGVGVGIVDHLTIDRINILQATRLAMGQALAALDVEPELVLTDYVTVPEILLSGDHGKIARWRQVMSLARTWQRRPDLLETADLSPQEQKWLDGLRQGRPPSDFID